MLNVYVLKRFEYFHKWNQTEYKTINIRGGRYGNNI